MLPPCLPRDSLLTQNRKPPNVAHSPTRVGRGNWNRNRHGPTLMNRSVQWGCDSADVDISFVKTSFTFRFFMLGWRRAGWTEKRTTRNAFTKGQLSPVLMVERKGVPSSRMGVPPGGKSDGWHELSLDRGQGRATVWMPSQGVRS